MLDCLQVTEVHGSRGLTDGQPRKGRRRRRTVSDGASRGLLPTAVMVYHTSDHRSCRQQRRMLRSCAACRKHPLLYVVHGARANACCLHGHIRRCSGFASSHSHRPLTLATSSLQARHPEHLEPSAVRQRQNGGSPGQSELNASGDDVVHGGRRPAIGNMHRLDPGAMAEIGAGDMRRACPSTSPGHRKRTCSTNHVLPTSSITSAGSAT